jgi:preprotein translocase SecE subunit
MLNSFRDKLPLGRGFLLRKEHKMSITEYIKETKAEMSHVNWPTKKQTIAFSVAVVIVSIVTAIALGAFDYIFNTLLTLLF